jgi:hypothetical protein
MDRIYSGTFIMNDHQMRPPFLPRWQIEFSGILSVQLSDGRHQLRSYSLRSCNHFKIRASRRGRDGRRGKEEKFLLKRKDSDCLRRKTLMSRQTDGGKALIVKAVRRQ